MEWSDELVTSVRYYLSYGYNTNEIAKILNKHPVTIRRIKVKLKELIKNGKNKM